MKRNDALIRLSHDHHRALQHVWKIRQGIKNGVGRERIISYLTWFFEQHLANHFKEEEDHVFNMIDELHPLRLQAFAEHDELRSLVQSIIKNTKESSITLYAHVLEAHIRFEERELFEYLQNYCPDRLNKYLDLQANEPAEQNDTWEDEFWLRN